MTSSPLVKVFDRQIIPWVEQFGISKVALAQPSWRAWQLAREHSPDDIPGTPQPLLSKRKAIKGRRLSGDGSLVDACWPEDHLKSSRAPKLAYVISGAVAFPLPGYQLHCRPGHGILVPPGVGHSDGAHLYLDDSVPGNVACQLLMLRPYSGGIECWLSQTRNGRHWSHHSPGECGRIANSHAVFYLENLTAEMLAGAPHYKEICNGLLNALVNLLCRELRQAVQLLPASLSRPVHHADPYPLERAQEYIRSNLSEPLSMDSVARYVYMSRRRFSDQFRQKTGQTFQEYLNDCRFEEACNLLERGDWPIEIIGRFVGLKPSRLRVLFHQRKGVSPSDFRRQKRNA
jgi:AraC-like DNA-binding protein